MIIAGQPYTITQAGAPCSYIIAPTSRSHGPASESGTIDVFAASGCFWTVVNTNAWVSLLSAADGAGTGTVSYRVLANTTGQSVTSSPAPEPG